MTGSDELSFVGTFSYYVEESPGGVMLAAYTIDPATGEWSIACRVGPTVAIPASCHPGFTFANRDTGCSAGVCTWD